MNDLKVNALKILNNSHLIEVITILYIFLLTEILTQYFNSLPMVYEF